MEMFDLSLQYPDIPGLEWGLHLLVQALPKNRKVAQFTVS